MSFTAEELDRPRPLTVFKLAYNALVHVFHDPAAMVLGSGFLLIMVWGFQGTLPLAGEVWSGWRPNTDLAGRETVIPGLPWDQEWIGFFAGLALLVVLPCMLIKLVFHQRLADYGLGLPPAGRRKFAVVSAIALFVLGLPAYLFAAQDDGMQAVYPLYRGDLSSDLDFVVYEAGYLAFFIAIEFVFRGYFLFGVFQLKDSGILPNRSVADKALLFGYYAVLISMLSYTAWHLGKPQLEVWGTVPWGLATGTIVLVTRSVLAVILVHWLLNVVLDVAIRSG